MTVSSSTRKAGPYIGAGSTATFPFSFKVFQASDVLVVKLNTATSVETTLTLTSDYTVSLNSDQDNSPGGNITLTAGALATGFNLVISSKVPYTQGTDITNMGGFYPEVIENALDKLTIEMQQVKEAVDRSAKLPITHDPMDMEAVTDDIVRIAASADNIDTVANNITDVNDVAGSIDNVNIVAPHVSTVDTVAGSIANVNAVGASIADVNTVADNVADVNTTADNIAAVNTVADDLNEPVSEINTVAVNIANVNTVGTNIASVNTVSTNIVSVAAVAADISKVNINAANIAAINTNAANITDIQNAQENAQAVVNAVAQTQDGVKQRFVAGTDFTAGTTTTLTLQYTPVKATVVYVHFNGVWQNADTWSLSGKVLTFTSALPNVTVEVAYYVGYTDSDGSLLVASYPKAQMPRLSDSNPLNGALSYNGYNTTATQDLRAGGFLIPNGQTGQSSYMRTYFHFTAARAAELAGRKCRFLITYKTSDNFLSVRPTNSLSADITGTAGTLSNMKATQISTNQMVQTFDYVFSGSETRISPFIQTGNSTAVTADAWILVTGQFMLPWDELGYADIDSNMVIAAVDETSNVTAEISVANGATYSGNTITIPSGQTGTNSYITTYFPIQRDLARAGETIRISAVFTTSANLLSTIGASYGANINSVADNVFAGSQSVANTLDVRVLSSTQVAISGDYVVRGGSTEKVGIFFQFTGTATTGSSRTITFTSTSYQLKSQSANQSAVTRRLSDMQITTGDLKDLVLPDSSVGNGATLQDNSLGIAIPNGQTGSGSYVRYKVPVSNVAKYVDSIIRVRTLIRTSDNLTTLSPISGSLTVLYSNGTANYNAARATTAKKLSQNLFLVESTYKLSGNETYIAPTAQIAGSVQTRTSDGFMTYHDMRISFDVAGGVYNTASTVGNSPADLVLAYRNSLLSDAAAAATIPAVEEISNVTPEVSAANGATASGNTLTIPAGQTGATSYVTAYFPIQREVLKAGDTVRLTATFTTSSGFFSSLGSYYAYNINSFADNVFAGQQLVAGTASIKATDTTITVSGDYLVRGGSVEKVGLYLQVTAGAGTTGANRTIYASSATYQIKNQTTSQSALSRRLADVALSSGDLKDKVTADSSVSNGATLRDNNLGVNVPTGQTGATAYVRYKIPVSNLAKFAGSIIRVRTLLRTSNNFSTESPLGGSMSVYYADGSANYGAARSSNVKKLSQNLYLCEYTYKLIGTETYVAPYLQISAGASTRTSDGFMTYHDCRVSFDVAEGVYNTAGTVGNNPTDLVALMREGFIYNEIDAVEASLTALIGSATSEVTYSKTITVKPDGTGNYTTLAAAISAEGGGTSVNRRVLYKVYEGVYTDTNYFIPNYADVFGIGQRDNIWLKGELPDNVAVATIPTVQTIWMNQTSKLRNLKVTARNMRYPIHSDSGASAYRALQEIEDCYVEHIGNEGARAYQTSIGGDPGGVWTSEHAWGCGTHSGQRIYSRRTTWVSSTSPWYFHTNGDFAEPCYLELDGSVVTCTTANGNAIVVQPAGSGQPDQLVIKGSEINGRAVYYPGTLSTQLYNQRGNLAGEVKTTVYGSSPIAYTGSNSTEVLELRSVDASGSSVAVSGTGATALFGSLPDTRAGGVGYPGRVYSSFAITGSVAGVGLGARLGDCTSTNKTLNIVFDGSVNKTITLNQNYTSMTNAQVITALNTALADATRGFYQSNPYQLFMPIYQTDREVTVSNSSSVAILAGMAVAYDGTRRTVRAATSSDARSLIAGIALENMAPGVFGRVLKDGQIHQQLPLFSTTPSFAFGDTFGVSSTAGKLVEAASIPLLRVIDATANQTVLEFI